MKKHLLWLGNETFSPLEIQHPQLCYFAKRTHLNITLFVQNELFKHLHHSVCVIPCKTL